LTAKKTVVVFSPDWVSCSLKNEGDETAKKIFILLATNFLTKIKRKS